MMPSSTRSKTPGKIDVNKEPVITVGISYSPAHAVEFLTPYRIPGSSELLQGPASVTTGGCGAIVECGGRRFNVDEEATLHPVDPVGGSFIIRDVVIGISFHWERKEDQRFSGALRLFKERGGIRLINVVPVEAYLACVISSEMSAASSLNLLEAHAITSRSWLLAQLERSYRRKHDRTQHPPLHESGERIRWYDREDHEHFDVCADDHCQRYQGITRATSDAVRQAIDRTRGMVLTYDGTICDARFSKSCGGITEPFENVWEPVHHPYLVSIPDRANGSADPASVAGEEQARKWIKGYPDVFCNTADRSILSQVLTSYDQETTDFFRWQVAYSQEELSALIAEKTDPDFGPVVDLVPLERGPSGRISRLSIVGKRKSIAIGKELEIRKTLSKSHLYSSAFIVEKEQAGEDLPAKFILTGAGWGHGVGLCQIGAAVMGAKGYSPEQILLHYFRGAKIVQWYVFG
jgi:stage II sporulation protein D